MGKSKGGIQERINSDGTKSYRAQIRLRGHEPISKTFARRTDAKAWIEQTRSAIRNGAVVSNEATRTTLKQALERVLRDPWTKKKGKPLKGWKRHEDRIKVWMAHPLASRFLSQLRGTDFADYIKARRAEGKAENTIRIEIVLISRLYKHAVKEWGMEGLRNPIASVSLPGDSDERKRRLEGDEEQRLLAELRKTGPYMPAVMGLAIETAMRRGEIASLTWENIDLQRRVAHLPDTKNDESRDVPLSSRAVAILKSIPRQIDSTGPVFPLSADGISDEFEKACAAAGIKDLRFHDLRHEATTRICELLPMHEAQKVTGHKTIAMLVRYYHPKPEDLAQKLG
jgi:integrase